MAYFGVSGVLHDGTHGVHLQAEDCPSASCYQNPASGWTGSTEQQVQDSANQSLANDGVAVSIVVSSLSPLAYQITML